MSNYPTPKDEIERQAQLAVKCMVESRRVGMSVGTFLEGQEFEGVDVVDLTEILDVAIGQIVRLTR